MTDQQTSGVQGGQTTQGTQTDTTTTQGGGVFGGSADALNFDNIIQSQEKINIEPNIEAEISIPEIEPVIEPIVQETPVIEPVIEESAPVIEPVVEETTPVIEPVVEEPAPVIEPVEEPTPVIEPVVEEKTTEEITPESKSDIKKKFDELSKNIGEISKILKLGSEDLLDIIGADNDKITTLYQFNINESQDITIKKIETEKNTEESSFNELKFYEEPETKEIIVLLDDVVLFEESDLLNDPKKKTQVMDKFNKFIFLTSEKLKNLEKTIKAKEEEERERRRLQDIFRNF